MKTRAGSRLIKTLFLTLAGFASAFIAGSLVAGWRLVRPNNRRSLDCIPSIPHGRLEPIDLFTVDGLRLHAWVLKSNIAAETDWVLLLHGFRSDRAVLHTRARFFARRGYNVLLLHFRGHGSSEPALITYGYNERNDVAAAYNFIRSLHPGKRFRIGINGVSMGAAAAAYAIGHFLVRPEWMILESCYDNIRHALRNRLATRVGQSLTQILALPIEVVVEHLTQVRVRDMDPAKALQQASCPILIMAGDAEEVLRMVEIEYLYGCIPDPKRLSIFPGAGHEDLLAYEPRRYVQSVADFLQEFAPHRQS